MLVEDGWTGGVGLRALCGGEALSTALSRRLVNRVATLWNVYGPTETTIWSSIRRIDESSEHAAAIEPIGRPIANTRIYVLDGTRQLVPIGVVGELYIGGAGVARGYLNRPELSAERFVRDPFSPDPHARLYKTGDLGRWRSDGTLQYLGRDDHQVKIRGYRIELGEIESKLKEHPQIKDGVVVARGNSPGEKRLVAYVVGRADNESATARVEGLRDYLKSMLPEYMVPGQFVFLEQLPLNASGKVDRKSLPEPEAWVNVGARYVAPATPTEEVLTQIWAEVLDLERVGVHDNFFDIGGHSLHAMQVIARIRDRLSVELPVRTLFDDAATVREQSGKVVELYRARQGVQLPALLPRAAGSPELPLVALVITGSGGTLAVRASMLDRTIGRSSRGSFARSSTARKSSGARPRSSSIWR